MLIFIFSKNKKAESVSRKSCIGYTHLLLRFVYEHT